MANTVEIKEKTMHSLHSFERAKERFDMKGKKAQRRIDLALERGKRAEDYTTKYERSYLNSLNRDSVAVAYDNACFIFNEEGRCITVHSLPAWWEKKKRYNGKERIRNAKKYYAKYY